MIKDDVGNKGSLERYRRLKGVMGKQYITSNIESPFDFISLSKKGINANVILNFRKYFDIPRGYTAALLNVSEPTIYRWIRGNRNLERNLSVHLFELADLFLFGIDVFQNKENFFKWLEIPNVALGGMEPKELLEISGGISKVHDLLGRIEHGIIS